MQQVAAFPNLQTVPAVPAAPRPRNPWILDRWRDLVLYVCTPLLLLPIFGLARSRWSPEDIYLFVAAFGAMGHHLPGMIRAYGDGALFERFKWRFIFAPIFLLVVCTSFCLWDLKGIVLIAFVWGVWHGMMQTYGFCRIYDAKAGMFTQVTRRLDFATCASWFAAGVLLSPERMSDTLETYYSAGGPFIPSALLRVAQQGALVLAIGMSAVFLANYVWTWVRGHRASSIKFVLLVTSIAFWWYCNNIVASILVGIALFEVFHDVQYLSLVWIYNRNRVEKDSSIGGFMRFVFRRSGSLIGLYVGLIAAYGSIGYFKSQFEMETVKRILTGIVTASGLLHFYYDGFIWKVREKSTRQSLGIAGGTADASVNGPVLPSWSLHGLKWASVFVVPLGAFWFWQIRAPQTELQQTAQIVADLPNVSRPHANYGAALQDAGRLDEAQQEFLVALQLYPKSAKAHAGLAAIALSQDNIEEARSHFEAALRANPKIPEYHSAHAMLLERLGQIDAAAAECETAVRLSPKSPQARYGYGAFLEKNGKLDEAIAQYRLAVQFDPNLFDAQIDLAAALFERGELQESKKHYLDSIRLKPSLAQPHNGLGKILLQEGKTGEAIAQFDEALRLHPDFPEAEQNLRLARGSHSDSISQPPR
jgi:tetratricopeptide (TPR) repeat protein